MPENKNHIANTGMNLTYGKQRYSEAKSSLVSGEPYKSNYILPEEITESTSFIDVARSIAENPNLWGIYSIADAFNGLVEWEVKKRLKKLTEAG